MGAALVDGVPDRDDRKTGLLKTGGPFILQPDLHQDDAVHPKAVDDLFERPVAVTAEGRQGYVDQPRERQL